MSSANNDPVGNPDEATRIIFTITPDAIEVDWELCQPIAVNSIVKTLAAINSGALIGVTLESLSQYSDEVGLSSIAKQVYDLWTSAIEKKSRSGPLVRPTQIFHD